MLWRLSCQAKILFRCPRLHSRARSSQLWFQATTDSLQLDHRAGWVDIHFLLAGAAVVTATGLGTSALSNRQQQTIRCDAASPARFVLPSDLLSDGTLDERYQVLDNIGCGSFGVVYRAVDRNTGVRYAVKQQSKQGLLGEQEKHVISEVLIHKALSLGRDPHFVHLVDVYEDAESIHTVMELCHGDLLDWMNDRDSIVDYHVAAILRDMIKSVVAASSMGYVHLDLKPENFMMTRVHMDFNSVGVPFVKLMDFGFADSFQNLPTLKELDEMRGSLAYMAPEVFQRSEYSMKGEVWSCGIAAFALLTNQLPFSLGPGGKPDIPESASKWEDALQKKLRAARVSKVAADLIGGMLKLDLDARLSLTDVLAHSFFNISAEQGKRATPAPGLAREQKLTRQAKGCRMSQLKLPPGQVLFSKGDNSRDVYFVREGSAPLEVLDGTFLLASVGPGGVVGEMAALRGEPRAFDVRCSKSEASKGNKKSKHPCLLLKMPGSSVTLLQDAAPLEFQYLHELADMRDEQMQTLHWLEQVPLFAGGERQFLSALSKRSRSIVMQPGEVLLAQGDAGNSMYMIREGTLDVYVRDEVSVEGLGRLVKSIGRGTCVGEMALLSTDEHGPSGRRMATVVVPADGKRAELLELSRGDLDDILQKFPDERARLVAVSSARLREIARR